MYRIIINYNKPCHFLYINHSIAYCRVEGEGRAVITDVIYQSKTSHHDKTTGDKNQYDKLQDEIKVLEEKVKLLSLKLDVNEKQKRILNKFAEQICKFSQAKVSEGS